MLSRDVTERRLLEREAAERAQELEAIFDTITDGIALLDREGNLVRTNRTFRRLLGFELHPEYLTLPHDQRIAAFTLRSAQGRPLLAEQWPHSAQLEGTEFTGVDLVIENLDRREIVVNVDGVSLRDRLGNITGYIEMYRDVTTRHHMEERTRETLGALVAMAEAMAQIRPPAPRFDQSEPSAVPYTADTTLSLVARRLAELTQSVLGCRQVSIAAVDPLTGHLSPITQVGLPPTQAQAWWASWSPPRRLAERYGTTIAATLAAGEPTRVPPTPLEPALDPLFGDQSGWLVPMQLGEELVGILLVDYDEPAPQWPGSGSDDQLLTTTLAHLGALVLERDRLLRGWAHTRANELALAETTARMDTFLGIASHELKTPLTSLKLSLQLAQRRLRTLTSSQPATSGARSPDPGLQQAVEQLGRTVHQMVRLEGLVNDLVDVSRIQAGKLELHPALTDLVGLVREAVALQQEAAPERHVQLVVERAAERGVEVEVDAGRIEQVMTNFLTNALKYSPADRPVEAGIEVESTSSAGTGVQPGVRVWVRDQGPGLSQADQEHIWERFHRVAGVEVQSGTGVGLGLGLYICRMIVERHHGQVGVQSAPGQGATFWFTLPLPAHSRDGDQ
jgi:signal transduction histidine kinase